MKIEGRVWKFGADVDTDAIIPARLLPHLWELPFEHGRPLVQVCEAVNGGS